MHKRKSQTSFTKMVDDTIKMPDKHGNGILKMQVSVDSQGKLARYSLAYINYRICHVDNGRVLGYDNNHGHHHRHFMGKEMPVKFESYEKIAEQFETEWRALHEQAKKDYC